MSGLPHNPEALRDQIMSGLDSTDAGVGPAAWEIFAAAHGLLWETVPPVEVSTAVLLLLSTEPDIEMTEGVVDMVGRTATQFSVTSPSGQFRNVVWLDPKTGTLLGELQELLTPAPSIDAAPPVVIKRATYLVSEVLDSTKDR